MIARRTRRCCWVRTVLLSVVLAPISAAQVTYAAHDQDGAVLIAAISTLSGERYQPDTEALVAGITNLPVVLSLVGASPPACRQAVAFAFDCWWARDSDGQVVLLNGRHTPRGALSVRVVTSSLRGREDLQPLVARLLAPWLDGRSGVSYLPHDGHWSAALDDDGHRRLIEVLSLLERPQAQAASRIPSPDEPDPRRTTTEAVVAHTWPALVDGLARALGTSVALSPRLRLRAFPASGVRVARMPLGEVTATLSRHGFTAHWIDGVLCLAEAGRTPAHLRREHPAQRRRLALIPIAHLIGGAVDGELLTAALRRHVTPDWWGLPGAGLEFLPTERVLLVAGDVDTQHAILDQVTSVDTLGLDLGLHTMTSGSR
jgi:hypothetical protein